MSYMSHRSSSSSMPASGTPSAASTEAPSNMPLILYAGIFRAPNSEFGPVVLLADHTEQRESFNCTAKNNLHSNRDVAIDILSKLTLTSGQQSYAMDERAIHYVNEDGSTLWFACIAMRLLGRDVPIGFLEALKQRCTELPPKDVSGGSFSMQDDMGREIDTLVVRFNAQNGSLLSPADRNSRMKQKMGEISDHIDETFVKLLDKQDKISNMVDNCHRLAESSEALHAQAIQLRRNVWWRNTRVLVFLVIALVLAIAVGVWLSCGMSLNCLRK